jgi:DNA modification methylase
MNKKLSDLIISKFTSENDFVLDPFMGMGTTAMSCIDLKRDYYGFEICKEYYDKCMERLNKRNMLNDPFECE